MNRRDGEFSRGWPVVMAAALGSGLGIAGLLTYTAGIFGKDLAAAIGLSRTALGGAFLVSTLTLAVALPLTGRLVDRIGPRWPAVVGAVALAGGFAALGRFTTSVPAFMALMAATGFVAAGSSPVGYTRAVSAAFERRRGLALGLTQVGIGLSAATVPPLLAGVVAAHGWRAGYHALALLALLGVVPALFLPRPSRAVAAAVPAAAVAVPVDRRVFVGLLAAFGTMAVAFAGMLPHFVPLLREAGLSAPRAGAIAGLIGVAVIVSRVVVGALADRYNATVIAAGCCAICAAGCVALAIGGAAAAPVAALALGSAMGAEADLIGFMTARYFGVSAYGRLYAVQYATFMVAAGISPFWIGAVADHYGGYRPALLVVVGGLAIAALLFLRLPDTRRGRQEDGAGAPSP